MIKSSIQRIKSWTLAVGFAAIAGGSLLTVGIAQSAYAGCEKTILTFPVWYRGLTDANCEIIQPTNLSNFIWHIVLNVIEIGLQAVIYIAIGFIIYGGFMFLTSAGDPSAAAKARTTILNAVIGLAISIASVAIVNLVLGIIG
jgi:hypothetical protein